MSEFMFPLAPRDQGWIELRERLARAARDIHFAAVTKDVRNGAELLMISENFAELAMSIPMCPPAPADLGGAPTLSAAQVRQDIPRMTDDELSYATRRYVEA